MKIERIISALLAVLTLVSALASCDAEPASASTGTEPVTVTETETQTEEPTGTDAETETEPVTEEPLPELVKMISVSELCADNRRFTYGCTDDWAELYNDEDEDVTLDSFFLFRDGDRDERVELDGITVPAKGYTVVRFDEQSPFRLPKEGGTLCLGYKKDTVSFLEYDETIGSGSFTQSGACADPTPGYPNTLSGLEQYKASVTLPSLYISEVMSSNKKYAPQDGKYYDWIELYNASDAPVTLSDYYLTDKYSELKRYRLPAVSLQPGAYYVVYCSGVDREGHAPFKISSDGEDIYLSDARGVTDLLQVPADLKQNESCGRTDGRLRYYTTPTPSKKNGEGYESALPAPTASLPSGNYDGAVVVSLQGRGKIYYTLDGTEPNEKSELYERPIGVDRVASIRAVCIDGGRVSALSSFFYTVGINHAYPVLEVAIKEEYLTGEKGVLVNINKEYEHEAYITLSDNGAVLFSAPCGLKLHGNDSKKGDKQNFQLRFRSQYGLGTLDYPLFDDRDYTKFNSLILHGGGEDYKFAGFREELCTRLVDGVTSLYVQACRPCVLYFNGEYRGIYWIRERIDAQYCANRLGVSKDSINLLHTYGTVSDGENTGYLALVKFCEKNDLKKEENYKYVMDRIDAQSLMDWYICRAYLADMDLANIKYFQSTEDDGKWHWCFFDLDWSFYHNNTKSIAKVMPNNGHHTMIRALLKNPEFEDLFIRRCVELLDTVLTEERVLKELDFAIAEVAPEYEANKKKYRLYDSTRQKHVDMIRDFVKDGVRLEEMKISIQSFFSLSDDRMAEYFGQNG